MTVPVDPRWVSELAEIAAALEADATATVHIDALRPALVKSMRTMAVQLRQLRRELQGGSR